VGFQASSTTRWIVNSEGTRVQTGEAHYRVTISAATRAEDGMSLTRYESFDASKPDRLPPESQVIQTIDQVISDVEALRRSPLAEPYVGPALLLGRAAGVFMHETLGHRAEGDRQKDDEEGQTFAKKLGKEVLPTFLSVYDDPTAERLLDTDLNGLYLFDDEGAKARRANIIEEGVFREFLRSRVPVRGVAESNGHGRRSAGRAVEARQGNLIVQPLRSIPIMALRQQLIQEARAQKKAYALLFKDIQGGYTQTSRASTQGFKVMPVLVYRVWTDGRPDELIRGVDIIGTPLTALSSITAAGDDYATFNGYCGSDSGWVPVSAVSPSLLFGRIEVGLREKGRDKPPVLPPPAGTENKP
jgi:predicted Zn-dependent protease